MVFKKDLVLMSYRVKSYKKILTERCRLEMNRKRRRGIVIAMGNSRCFLYVHMGSRMPSHLPSPLIAGEEEQERKIKSYTWDGEVSGSGQCLPSCSASGSLPHRRP
jgi:predicted nucleic acid-binding Zn ribbon protein